MYLIHSFRDIWVVVANVQRDRLSRSHSRQNFSPCDHPTVSPCDRPLLPQCKTPSLRPESGKRSAGLSTIPSVQTFGATLPNDTVLDFWVLSGASEDRNKPTHPLAGAPERCLLAKRFMIRPTQADGATT